MADATTAENYAGLQEARNADAAPEQGAVKTGAREAKLSVPNAVLLVLVALLIDGLQLFLNLIIIGVVVNWIIDVFALLLFYVWLKMLGMSMYESRGFKTLLSLIGAMGVEIMPLVNSLPGWTAFATLTVIFEFSGRMPVVGKLAKLASFKKS
ncbi:hypothetical protein A2661_02200 [Candidatus Giovannonibacteria bacterium RIFCSPHIGHO2_01_FULL_45_24]|uniref:Uncharacterized protein n=1 Tax=Candidatus Giovannonibacteria bacterium RIFCSPLOWO2_01_FULL_46_32 TaxID=1798353 RepID=A0A1F5XI01_9BACT|nr:MAG: hypothetical protein A2661_02200 [Candidatus Giovannonibacteria bacterium RIFCSPHIGHO2_01_FULL_45_24]OGF87509.1 MAG: hypothetical protein A3B19_02925 [Candidatus Giovannonibacteria bacterium RIFCSPLOWO2_01_FULL_46_32]